MDAAAACVDGVGLVVFGGVGATFDFVSSTAWLLPAGSAGARDGGVDGGEGGGGAGDAHGGGTGGGGARAPDGDDGEARRAAARQDVMRSLTSPWDDAPCPRACACVCASDALQLYMFGGFDGTRDLDDLWCLSLAPTCFRRATGGGGGGGGEAVDALALADGGGGGTLFGEASGWRAWRAMQVARLAGENCYHSPRLIADFVPRALRQWQADDALQKHGARGGRAAPHARVPEGVGH